MASTSLKDKNKKKKEEDDKEDEAAAAAECGEGEQRKVATKNNVRLFVYLTNIGFKGRTVW